MSEPGLRLLDKGLPRLEIFNPEFKRRMDARRRREGLEQDIKPLYVPPPPTASRADVLVHRREMAALAKAIHAQTRALKPTELGKPVSTILQEVASQHRITVKEIKGSCRAVFVVAIRFQAITRIYLAHPGMSVMKIAQLVGRDHNTVRHALNRSGHYQAIGAGHHRGLAA